MALMQTARVVTPLGADALLFFSMEGSESLGQPFEYQVELLSEDEQIDLTQLLGQPMVITLELPNGQFREFSGLTTRFVLVGSLGNYTRYLATIRPWLWLMTRRSNCRIFQNKTVPQVVMDIFREHGFSDFEDKLTAEYRTWEFLVQYRESDFNFVNRIMEQEGIYYYFVHAEGKHKLILSDSYSAHQTVPGYEIVPYVAEAKDHPMDDTIDSWRVMRQITSGAFAVDDYDFEAPKAKLSATSAPGSEYTYGDFEVYDYPGEVEDNKQATDQVKVRLDAELALHDTVEGAGNARGVQTGALMTLADFPRPEQNKEYLVTGTSITIRGEAYESLVDANSAPEAPTFRVVFKAIDSKRVFRPLYSTPKPSVRGPQTAVVVGQSGQEIWTDEYARVKVQFRWDREGTFDENSSCWVRVAQVWAGSGWGGIHIPRIGQEVIVDFLEGNPDRPLITGRLYNADNMPPYTLPQNQTQSGIKSHSTKGGGIDNFNEIRFEDKKDEEELHIQAEKDMTTLVKHDQTTDVLNNRVTNVTETDTVTVTGDRSLTVHKTNTVTVDKAETETFNDTRDVTVTGPDTLTITHSHTGDYKAERTLTIKGPDKVTVQSGGKKNDVTGKYEHIASEEYEAKQGKNIVNLKGTVAKVTNGSSTITLDGGKVTIEAPEQIELKVGGNTFKIASAGTIDATASNTVTLAGATGTLTLASASADLNGSQVNVTAQGTFTATGPVCKIG